MRSRRAVPAFASLLTLILSCIAAPAARAQIYAITLKDPATAKRLSYCCVERNGKMAVIGEAKSGITEKTYQGEKGVNELWVVNTSDPLALPYVLDGTNYKPSNVKGGVVALRGNEIEKCEPILLHKTLYAFSRDYLFKKALVNEMQKARDAQKSGTGEWSLAHGRYLAELVKLQSWLETTFYPEAAKKLGAEIERQRKVVAKEARVKRLADALASVHLAPTPAPLAELAKKLIKSDPEIKVQESRHLRITYQAVLNDDVVKGLLELGEKAIDGFRVDFVDPWIGEDWKDPIPDTIFQEWWFGPEQPDAHEHFLVDWYGFAWGDHKQERLAAMSGRYRREKQPEYLDYWKIADNKDFDGIVLHGLGHTLANLAYNQDRKTAPPAWLEESVGYWLAISYIGRNTMTCNEFVQQQYAKPKNAPSVERSNLTGITETYLQSALENGVGVDTLTRRPLSQMTDGDLSKAWSFYEYLAAEGGKPGQQWLKASCDLLVENGMQLAALRAKSEECFGVKNEDVFKVLDDRWKKHAQELLKKGAPEPKH